MNLSKIKELKKESDIDIVNLLLKKGWLLFEVTVNVDGKTTFLMARVS